jgi:hypothetical protein
MIKYTSRQTTEVKEQGRYTRAYYSFVKPPILLWMPRAWQSSCNKYIVVLILVISRTSTQSINESVNDSVQCITNILSSGIKLLLISFETSK